MRSILRLPLCLGVETATAALLALALKDEAVKGTLNSGESISDFDALKCFLSLDCTPKKQPFLATGRVPKILLCRILKLTCSLLGNEREQHAFERR